jgi:class 3 adenylate cyclase/tetratricopeptide (TPR) repeat protein
MREDDTKNTEPVPDNLENALREKDRLDQIIKQKFYKKLAILFSDVCGYTQYTEKMGDIKGRQLIQKYCDVVLPLIEGHGGTVIDIIGDGIMASFPDALSASNASLAIQRGLDEYNSKTDLSDLIHVKIGINAGKVLVEKDNVAGDVVNVASRIQSQAGPDQILISKSVYDEICGSDDILCSFNGKVKFKGKSEPMELYQLKWKAEKIVLSAEPITRNDREKAKITASKPQHVLYIEVGRVDNNLKISAFEQAAGEIRTVRQYEDMPVTMDKITDRCRGVIETLNKANRRGRIAPNILNKLREVGQVLSDDLFTQNVKEKIRETNAEHLIINLDDQLVQIPWELLHDGQTFLCQKYSMGRLVKTKQGLVDGGKARNLARPLKMLILADPKGDLKGAYSEGIEIRDFTDKEKDLIHTSLLTQNVTANYIREKVRNFDLIHFAGHYDYHMQNPGQSGWRLTNESFTAHDISKMAGVGSMPALIFSNACQSARTEEWVISETIQNEIFGLANAFILAGVKHYVGTFWEVLDEPSRRFALEFYKHLLVGLSTGEAVRQARLAVIEEYGEETIVWASYVLYGDPIFNYMDEPTQLEAVEIPEAPYVKMLETGLRAKEEVIDFTDEKKGKKLPVWLTKGAAVVVILVVLLFSYQYISKKNTAKIEKAAVTALIAGNYEKAISNAKILADKDSEKRLSYLIQGEVYLRRGDLDSAKEFYEKALSASKGTDLQKAKAFIGLGRIASIKKQTDVALNYYQQSTKAAPQNELGYFSQGLLLEKMGEPEEALNLLDKARQLAPQNRALAAVTNQTRKKVRLQQDQEKQDRINKLVKELLEGMERPSRALPSDGWTSPPMTIWIMDFDIQGYSIQEAEDRLLFAGITDIMLQRSRARLVERSLLDKMLQELKISTSDLADRKTALSLGKLLAARLILAGQITYSGPQTQVSLRLIETETGRINAAVTETVGSATPVSNLADKLSDGLIKNLQRLFPLRGKIVSQNGREVTINIGQNVGVQIGMRFKMISEDVTLEVIDTQESTSHAKIVKGEKVMEEGQRVEAFEVLGDKRLR